MSVATLVSQSTATQNRGRESAAEEAGVPGINRREFLIYAWGAALDLLDGVMEIYGE